MSTRVPLWYVDTCILVSLIKQEEIEVAGCPRWYWSKQVFEKAERGEITIVTSAITLVELNGGKEATSKHVLDQITAIFDADYILPVNLSVEIASLARSYIWDLRRERPKRILKTADAIHLASAVSSGCSRLITWDDGDLCKLDMRIPELVISGPNSVITAQQTQMDFPNS